MSRHQVRHSHYNYHSQGHWPLPNNSHLRPQRYHRRENWHSIVNTEYHDDSNYVYYQPEYPEPSVVLLTDSILKYCNLEKVGGKTVKFRGADLTDLIFKQRNGELPNWYYYDLVIIHCGTNDVANGEAKFVYRRIQTLIKNIKKSNSKIDIIVSSILPRPCDATPYHRRDPIYNPYAQYKNEHVKSANSVLKLFCMREEGVHFWPSFHTLVSPGSNIKTEFYARDGLHLNWYGTKRMERILKTIITRYYKGSVPFGAN